LDFQRDFKNLGRIWACAGSGPDLGQIWAWAGPGPDLGLIWTRSGPDLGLGRIWAGYVANLGLGRIWAIRWFRNAKLEQGSLSEPARASQNQPEPARPSQSQPSEWQVVGSVTQRRSRPVFQSQPEPARASQSQPELARGNVQACSKELAGFFEFRWIFNEISKNWQRILPSVIFSIRFQ
jgi:hypothetical protein